VQVVWLRDPSAWVACGEEEAGEEAAVRHAKGPEGEEGEGEEDEVEEAEEEEEAEGGAAAAGRARGMAGRESLESAESPEPYTKLLCSELGPADVMVSSE
jgi:hypothetical protein